jgi:hypothetical protein
MSIVNQLCQGAFHVPQYLTLEFALPYINKHTEIT